MGKTKGKQEGTKEKGKKKVAGKSVSYHGQRPHRPGKRPGPLVCFTSNLKNALRKAFPGFKRIATDESSKKCKSRIECLMDFLSFDINQLLIYENQKRRCKRPALIHQLRVMKLKVEEIKTISLANKCTLRAEEMLKRKSHLKCTSRALRKGLIEFMANVEQTDRRSKIVCEIMTQLDLVDMDIAGLCKAVREMPIALTCDIQTTADIAATVKRKDCGDVKISRPQICEEVLRPYDPITDEDSSSIHLRYIPALDSFKAHMARNPCALRLPLMCPAMKRIMNKMKVSYLMDDVPVKLEADNPKSKADYYTIVGWANVEHNNYLEENEGAGGVDVRRRTRIVSPPMSCKNRKMQVNGKEISLYSFKDISKLWLPTIKQIKEICS